jgi:hypothetical protein
MEVYVTTEMNFVILQFIETVDQLSISSSRNVMFHTVG